MLRSVVLVPVLFLALVATHLDAQDCQNPTTTAAMRECENKRYEDANRKLQTVYSQALASLSVGRKQKLRAAESAWILFREKNAEFSASAADGGTMAPLLRITALADMTEQRLKELSRLTNK